MADHRRQVAIEQRLADALHHRAAQIRQLIDQCLELVERELARGFLRRKRQRAGGALAVAAVGDLEVGLDRRRQRLAVLGQLTRSRRLDVPVGALQRVLPFSFAPPED